MLYKVTSACHSVCVSVSVSVSVVVVVVVGGVRVQWCMG